MILVSQAISKKSEEVSILDKSSLSHCSYIYTYHIVFIPKYKRRIMYGTLKKDIVEILKKLLEMKGVVLIEGKLCKDHVHLYVSIPPKIAISEAVGYIYRKFYLIARLCP